MAVAGAATATGQPATAQAPTAVVAEAARCPAGRPLLIHGATVVTMDRARAILPDTDVLMMDSKIKAVGKRLTAPQAIVVIGAKGALLIPGFVDTHRHMWKSALRGVRSTSTGRRPTTSVRYRPCSPTLRPRTSTPAKPRHGRCAVRRRHHRRRLVPRELHPRPCRRRGLDLARARRLAEASHDHMRTAVGETAWQHFINPPRT
ncbi:hypothetical protein ACWD3I_24295 [Streptomyces sp. NPDC002817]